MTKNNSKHGNGKLTFPDGTTLKGEFKDGSIGEKVKLEIPLKGTYEGEIVENHFKGRGKL